MVQTKAVIAIVNVVASATIEQKLDLVDITKKFPHVEYHPEQFPGAVFRLQEPKTATLLFGSGNMVCTGAKSEEMAIQAVNTVVRKLRKGRIKIKKEPKVTIQNIVSSINLGGKVNLEQAARTLPRSMYEPEQFPGLIHRMLDPKTVILIFASGKLVCVGAKLEKEIHRSVNQIHSLLEEKNLMVYENPVLKI
ncbi:TATA-box binding family protein [Candidatus Nitrosopumilus koreensis AR1]|uniref:TATA-box-binding protein n=1 Tax=Candidatus Nitrosopumilus koreensis AR1 TaxID=1229908 RepID=K0B7A6_9ARCH|nr:MULTISPECIES: TATA-box-binding protein [Nitrosopumilus]AFS81364.1 TATA-box binding family protein [Candidatus Nitrosopumilus koreensis AR1]